jgi:hypothetical protein
VQRTDLVNGPDRACKFALRLIAIVGWLPVGDQANSQAQSEVCSRSICRTSANLLHPRPNMDPYKYGPVQAQEPFLE